MEVTLCGNTGFVVFTILDGWNSFEEPILHFSFAIIFTVIYQQLDYIFNLL